MLSLSAFNVIVLKIKSIIICEPDIEMLLLCLSHYFP